MTYYKEIKNSSLYIGNLDENDQINISQKQNLNSSQSTISSTNQKNAKINPKISTACSPNSLNQIKENNFFLKILPKISHKVFQGKELCPSCHKKVMENQQSVSCDQCHRWTHRICCKMTLKNYKDHKNYEITTSLR